MNRLIRHEFSTHPVPQGERSSIFCEELMCRHAAVVPAAQETPFSGTIKRCQLGLVEVASVSTTIAACLHMRELTGDDGILAIIGLHGRLICTRGDQSVMVEPGDGIVCDSVDQGGLQMEPATRCWALRIPRADMARTVPHVRRFAGLKLNSTLLAVRLLARYLDGLQAAEAVAEAREARVFGEHLLDLLGMAIGMEGNVRHMAERRGVRAVRHAAVLREIERNISDSRLSAAVVAERLGVTPRYVHFLLEESGRTFSEHVLIRRLKRVEELLGDAAMSTLKISVIARQAGFTDMSYFNRCFRNHFHDTPTGYRSRLAHSAGPAAANGPALKCA